MPPLQPISQGARKIHARSAAISGHHLPAAALAVAKHGRTAARSYRWLAPTVLHSTAVEYAYRVLSLCCRTAGCSSCASILCSRAGLLRSRYANLSAGTARCFLAADAAPVGYFLRQTFFALVRRSFPPRLGVGIRSGTIRNTSCN